LKSFTIPAVLDAEKASSSKRFRKMAGDGEHTTALRRVMPHFRVRRTSVERKAQTSHSLTERQGHELAVLATPGNQQEWKQGENTTIVKKKFAKNRYI
jgi:hypothetical protein